jgi:deoxycytidylate deaminase
MYVTLHPCADCARAIHQTGIKELIIPGSPDAFVFSESQHQGALLLQRVGLPVRWWQGELPKLEILHDGFPQKIGFR